MAYYNDDDTTTNRLTLNKTLVFITLYPFNDEMNFAKTV